MDTQILFFLLYLQVIYAARTPFANHLCTNATVLPTKTCPSAFCLNVSWTVFPPYAAYNAEEKNVSGIIPRILRKLLAHCCNNSWNINMTKVEKRNIKELDTKGVDIVFPYFCENKNDSPYHDMWFVPLVNDPSVDFITKRQSTKGIPKKLFGAILSSWPVLIIALLFSFVAGILLWLLEFRSNPEEFPRSFSKGSWEGFWWAFVSMTTVGYGDRSPRTILGRGFAVIWILMGICICSIFTATLTTSLTTLSLEDQRTLSRAKVGVVRNSLEATIGVQYQAKILSYDSLAEVWDALEQDYVDGILLDSFFSATPKQHENMEDKDFKIVTSVKCDAWSYGLLAKGKIFADCMKGYFDEKLAHEIPQDIADAMESDEGDEDEAQKRSASMLDITGGLFFPTLYVCFPFVVLMICIGLIWEFCLLRKQIENESNAEIPRNDSTLDKMEKEMVSDVHRLFASWKAKLAKMGRAGPLELTKMEEKA